MIYARSFIGRLIGEPSQPLVEVVAVNLENVLNTRKGSGSVIREFGLGDYERAATTHESVLILIEEIAELCRRYEPRLREPKVSLLGRSGYDELRFELEGQLAGHRQLFWLDMSPNHRTVKITIVEERGA
jgi:type VI secretion system lysozyme-like protein